MILVSIWNILIIMVSNSVSLMNFVDSGIVRFCNVVNNSVEIVVVGFEIIIMEEF